MPRNPNNPRRKFATAEERKQAIYERQKRWREANPEKARASVERFYARNPRARQEGHLSRTYGISVQEFDTMLAAQGGGCRVCAATNPGRRSRSGAVGQWIVDHCHDTGRVRGILCHPCNAAIGMARENPDLLRALADYLSR